MVYCRYSNASRGKRRKSVRNVPRHTGLDSPQPHSPAQHYARQRYARQRRRNRARLLKKIYELDPPSPLRKPHGDRCLVEDWAVIRKILQHLNLRERTPRSPPPRLPPYKPEAFPATLSPRQAQRFRASTDSVFRDDVPVCRA